MAKTSSLQVRGRMIRTMRQNRMDYICITDIARQKNPAEPKDVVKNWMRLKNTLEYLGLWEQLNNPSFKGVEFDPIIMEAGSNAFTMSPSRWVALTGAIGILSKNGAGGGTMRNETSPSNLPAGCQLNSSRIYASEADVLNVALFGMTALEWRETHPDLKGNIRDYASINELICLSNMENLNAVFISEGLSQSERLIRLNRIAIHQMQILEDTRKYLLQ